MVSGVASEIAGETLGNAVPPHKVIFVMRGSFGNPGMGPNVDCRNPIERFAGSTVKRAARGGEVIASEMMDGSCVERVGAPG